MTGKKPILTRADITELFDRNKLNLYDLMQIAFDKDFNIVIRINSNGDIDFETYEFTEDKIYEKTQSQTADGFSYTESVNKRKY